MDAALLRVLVTAAGKSIEQGTLVEIIATATRLMTLIEPLFTKPGASDRQPGVPGPESERAR